MSFDRAVEEKKASAKWILQTAKIKGTLTASHMLSLHIYQYVLILPTVNNIIDKANFIGFIALSQDHFLPGTCGKASFTPIHNIATG